MVCTPNENNVIDPNQTSLDKNKEVLVLEHPIRVLLLLDCKEK